MREVEIAYLYEHAGRELDVACAVAARLRRDYGIQTEIFHWPTGFPRSVLQIRPRLVILPFCYTEKSYEALLAYWRTARFFNLTWEQLFYAGNQKAKTPRGEFAVRHVVHHAWSEFYADFLRQNGIPERQIFLNGQPAYALYDAPYRAYFCSRTELAERYHLDPARRWIFFPENYNWAFYSERTIKRFIESGQSPADIRAMQEYCDHSLSEVVQWLAEAARTDRFEVIVRPRPSTTLAEFRLVMEKILPEFPSHLHVIQQESVREWILASDLVFSSHSTSLIEAAVAGKPVFMLEPYEIPDALKVGWHKFVPHVGTQVQFLEICSDRSDSRDDRLAKWARATLMSHGDSISNLASFIASFLHGKVEAPSAPSRAAATPMLRFIPPAWIWSLYRRLKQGVRHPETSGVEPGFVKDVVGPAAVEENIRKWACLLDQDR